MAVADMRARRMTRHDPADISAGTAAEGEAGTLPGGQVVTPVRLVRGKRIIDLPRIEIGQVPVKILDAGENRQAIRFSVDTAEIVIGGANVTVNSGLLIRRNALWIENDAPDAEWWAVAGTNINGFLRRQIITKD